MTQSLEFDVGRRLGSGQSTPRGDRSKLGQEATLKFGIHDCIRHPREHALQIIHVDGLAVQTHQIEVTACNRARIADFFGSDAIGQGTLDFNDGKNSLPAAPPLAASLRAVRNLPEETTGEIAEKKKRLLAAKSERQLWS